MATMAGPIAIERYAGQDLIVTEAAIGETITASVLKPIIVERGTHG